MNYRNDAESERLASGSSLGEEPVSARGEIALWRAVITQALMDAGSHSSKVENKVEKYKAKAWLLSMSREFVDVCAMAQMDADFIRDASKRALENDCQWRKFNPNSFQAPTKKREGKLRQKLAEKKREEEGEKRYFHSTQYTTIGSV